MVELLPRKEFLALYLERGLIPREILVKHAITGELLPDVEVDPPRVSEADEVSVSREESYYDASTVRELLGPMRDVLREAAKRRRVFTRLAPLVNIRGILARPDGTVELTGEFLPYHYVRMINNNADFVLREVGLYKPMRLRDALRPLVLRRGKLVPLERSALPNPLSVHILLVSSDGYAIVVRRSERLSILPGTLSVVEGYIDADRDADRYTGTEAAFVEITDEAGLNPGEARVYYLGLYRTLRTLGRPMAFFLALFPGSGEALLSRVVSRGSREHSEILSMRLAESAGDPDAFLETLDYEALRGLASRDDASPTLKLITHILETLRRA